MGYELIISGYAFGVFVLVLVPGHFEVCSVVCDLSGKRKHLPLSGKQNP